ncbi:MAG: MtaA/CmuA family methyltransferase [Candidatus Methanofastidiosia archaeon]
MVEEMTPKKRVLSALMGGRVDRIPGVGLSSFCLELMEKSGISWPEVLKEPESIAKLATARYEIWGVECIMPGCDSVLFAEALGADINWGSKGNHPSLKRPLLYEKKEPEDVSVPENLIERGRFPQHLKACDILREKHPDLPIMTGSNLGFEGAGDLFGYDRLMAWAKTDVEKCKLAIDFSTEMWIEIAKEFVAHGIDFWLLGDAGPSQLLSPEMYHELMTPFYKKMNRKIGIPSVQHLCGDFMDKIHILPENGFDAFSWDPPFGSVREVRYAIGDKMALWGGVSVLETLYQGTPEDVKFEAYNSMKDGVNLLSPGCGFPPTVKTENVKAMIKAAHDFEIEECFEIDLEEFFGSLFSNLTKKKTGGEKNG